MLWLRPCAAVITLAFLATITVTVSATARPYGHHARNWNHHRVDRHHGALGKPARFIRGRLVCAVNVNAALARRGIRGTGSALARSFLHWGRATKAVPGAVAVFGRRGGGHVAIVAKVEKGRVWVWNPSSRSRGWRLQVYNRPAIAYRTG